MNLSNPPNLSVQIPGAVTNPISRQTVSRKAVPARKPVGQPAASTNTSKINNPSPQVRQSTSTSNNIPPLENIQGTGAISRNRSSISSFATYSVAQPPKALDGPLPQAWSSARDPDGRTYYLNHLTKATTWNRPELVPSPLMHGWEERMTPDGRVFYCNTQTQTTTWERPSVASSNLTVAPPSSLQGKKASQPDQKLVTLPLWWEARTTQDGRVYFCNTQTQVTAWELPLDSNAQEKFTKQLGVADMEAIPPPSLPSGWEERRASDGRAYFCNLETQVTTWERPLLSLASSMAKVPTGMESPLSPLSSNWVERRTSSGHATYFNTATNQQTNMPPTPPNDFPFEKSMTVGHTQSDLPPTPISPTIDWESPQYQSKSARRRSHFSLGSISSASTIANRMSKMRIPSGPSSTAVVNGTKNAAEISLKGMKTAAKVLKNNKGVIIVTLKVANTILKSTTGVDLGGVEDLFGGDVDVDVGDEVADDCGEDEFEADAETEDEIVLETCEGDEILAEPQGSVVEQDFEPPPDECAPQDQQPTYLQEVYVTDQYVVATDAEEVVVADPVLSGEETVILGQEQIVVVDEEQAVVVNEDQFVTSTTTVQELTFEQQVASGAFSGDSVWVQDTVLIENTVSSVEAEPVVNELCIQEAIIVGTDMEYGPSNELVTQGVMVEEFTITEEVVASDITSQQAACQEIVAETTVTEEVAVQVTICAETAVQEMDPPTVMIA